MGYFSSVGITALDRRDLHPINPPAGYYDDPREDQEFDPRTGPGAELTDDELDALPRPTRQFDATEADLPL